MHQPIPVQGRWLNFAYHATNHLGRQDPTVLRSSVAGAGAPAGGPAGREEGPGLGELLQKVAAANPILPPRRAMTPFPGAAGSAIAELRPPPTPCKFHHSPRRYPR